MKKGKLKIEINITLCEKKDTLERNPSVETCASIKYRSVIKEFHVNCQERD